ncbi:MAG: inositol monophosphatase family protein [Candidatus Thorarchaeota archaeon]
MRYKDIAIKAAKKSGKILKNNFFKQVDVEGKGKHDVVTETDRESEVAILEMLKGAFPEHSFVAEESGSQQGASEYTWYIDPLDGTSNFITGNPYFSVSIALALKEEIILSIIFNPILDEMYIAEKGKGAFMNNERLYVSENKKLSEALLASAYSMDERDIKRGLKTIEALALSVRKVIINFSPALDLCNIARGRIDGLVDNGTTPEDHAAGSLILSEAGGVVQNYDDKNWDVNKVGIIASNGVLQNFLTDIARGK